MGLLTGLLGGEGCRDANGPESGPGHGAGTQCEAAHNWGGMQQSLAHAGSALGSVALESSQPVPHTYTRPPPAPDSSVHCRMPRCHKELLAGPHRETYLGLPKPQVGLGRVKG